MHDPHAQQTAPLVYFFHIYENGSRTGESDGLDFHHKQDAWREAAISCSEIMREMDGKMQPGFKWQMDVADQTGNPVFRFTFTADEF
jgi:hypothetical protein